MGYPVPRNEVERLKALQDFGTGNLDSIPGLDRACRMARELFGVSLAAITLLDDEHQWFVTKCGTTITKTARDHAFCNYTILHNEVFHVEDALKSREFAANPYVIGEPYIRFYAGAPLVIGRDIRVGSLCVIDDKPRPLSESESDLLLGLSRLVVDELWVQRLARMGSISADLPPIPAQPSQLAFDWQPMITSAQVRAARGLLNWSVQKLAFAAGVSPMTVKRLEGSGQVLCVREDGTRKIREALERAGVVFVFAPDRKPGVCPG